MAGILTDEFAPGDAFSLHCSQCHAPRLFGCVVVAPNQSNGPWGLPCRWVVGVCEECGHPAVGLQERINPGQAKPWDDLVLRFPASTALPRDGVPEPVGASFREAARCFELQMYASAAVMARKSVELACVHEGGKGKNLQDDLVALLHNGRIDADLHAWSDAVRGIGNQGAHEETIDREDAEDAIAFAEALAERLFVMPHRFARFMARMSQADANGTKANSS